jgi:hypothetical protein
VDALADVASGEVGYLVIDPGGLLPHDVLLVPAEHISSYDSDKMRLDITKTRSEATAFDNVLDEVSLARTSDEESYEARFRRLSRILEFRVVCMDGAVGTASDFLLDPGGWRVRYLVVDTHELRAEHEVLVPVEWISEIDWELERVMLRMTQHRFRISQHASAGSHARRVR